MSTDSSVVVNQRPAIEFKSSTFAVPALIVNHTDLREINLKITEKVQQAPEFFKNSPILLDVQAIAAQKPEINVVNLIKLMREKSLIPIALRGGTPIQNELALKSGLFIQPLQTTFEADKSTPSAVNVEEVPAVQAVAENTTVAAALHSPIRIERRTLNKKNTPTTKIITAPIRSGQRVYSDGDLIIMAPVSAGAEIMAEGNIHVYGSLRGRALAGVLGKPDSRIFCFDCQAELIAIAGNYKVNDDLDQSMMHKPVQIYLQEQALIIKAL